MEGIVEGLEVEARARTEAVAKAVVNTFAPVPTGDGADPEAQPEVPAEAAAEGVGGAHPHGVRAQAGAGLEDMLVGERRRYEL